MFILILDTLNIMKNCRLSLLTLVFALLSISWAEAQYGYGNGSRYGRQRSGLPRGPEPQQEEAKPLTAEEIVAEQMPQIMEVVPLNAFEEAVVSSILTKYVQQSIELRILGLEADKMREGMEKIRINQKAELEAGLPADKFAALMDLQENGFKKAKQKNKKKKKGKKPKD
ncbi:hypothetical protein CLV82_2254 [Zeaxanthinibacter enoshimensis]|uniref:Uncharacterized protein n=2 Tax=Zeaxanthinibacter enoshimensis TaxID=392009 RepID=A0A4R6TKZ9_9FLAO|nr:hypothetical protein CLV82_2254 [Zeaxanthinibacter enoshimensis]